MLTVINSAVRDAQAPGNQREVVAGITATRPNRYTSTRAVTCPRQPRSPPRPPRRSHPACRPCPPGPRAGGCLRPPIPITSPPTSPSPSPSVLATAAANDRGDGNLSPRPREKGGWGGTGRRDGAAAARGHETRVVGKGPKERAGTSYTQNKSLQGAPADISDVWAKGGGLLAKGNRKEKNIPSCVSSLGSLGSVKKSSENSDSSRPWQRQRQEQE